MMKNIKDSIVYNLVSWCNNTKVVCVDCITACANDDPDACHDKCFDLCGDSLGSNRFIVTPLSDRIGEIVVTQPSILNINRDEDSFGNFVLIDE